MTKEDHREAEARAIDDHARVARVLGRKPKLKESLQAHVFLNVGAEEEGGGEGGA